MEKVTAEEVQSTVKKHGITRYKLRSCSICNGPLFYLFQADRVAFNSNCDCGFSEPLQLRSYEDLVSTFNMQSPEVRERMWQEFVAVATRPPDEAFWPHER